MTSVTSLTDFTKLNSSVHFRRGETATSKSSTPHESPNLILFLSWGGAPLRLVDKYTRTYASIFPSSPVLLIQTEFSHILTHTRTSQDRALEPALSILKQHIRDQDQVTNTGTDAATATRALPTRTRILVHLFSNGGSYKLIEVAKRYKSQTGSCLPIDTLILDSAPGISTIVRSFKALSYALPSFWLWRRPLQVLLFLFLIVQRSVERLVLGEGLLRLFRRQMNDPALIDGRAKRCYIYGPGDELVGWRDVKDHAADARRMGCGMVEEETFEGTAHVAHMRGDPERYWGIVRRIWDAERAVE